MTQRSIDELLEIFCGVARVWAGRPMTDEEIGTFTRGVVGALDPAALATLLAAPREDIERQMLAILRAS